MKKNLPWITEALIASAYSPSSFERSSSIDDYRERLNTYGEQIRWWKGYEKIGIAQGDNFSGGNSDHTHYIEQSIPRDVRVLFSRAQQELFASDFKQFEDACAMLTFPSTEIELARGDVIVRISSPILHRCVIEPSGKAIDALPHYFIASIQRVFDDCGEFPTSMYAVHEHGLKWRVSPPSSSVFIEYRYYCAFEFLGRIGSALLLANDDNLVAQLGALRLLTEETVCQRNDGK
ncbi:hypothetical protein IAD21_01640 [Abditibacteriota bacterium]|nr:hypothetical protein IAD21_01640 [Abditibacteriota bacterium]